MAQQQIDYDKLASEHGGQSAEVDYDALASELGGQISSQGQRYPHQGAVDALKGIGAGVLSTAYHGGDILRRVLGMERVIDDPAAQEAMTPPDSFGGKLGFYGEQMGEFLVPAGMVSKAVKGSRLATRMGAEAATAAGIAGVQSGGDPSTMVAGGVIGGALPVAGAAVKPLVGMASRAAAGAREGGIGGAVAGAIRSAAPQAPKAMMTQALKPRATNTGFTASLDRSMPELKAAEATIGRPIAGIADLLDATKAAKRAVRAQFDQMAGPAKEMGSTVDLTPVANAIKGSIPKRTALQSPEAAAAIRAKAEVYGQRFSLEDAEQLLRETNAELEGYYAKYPTAQRRALASDPVIAGLDAEAKALRTAIYESLDAPGQGEAARELQRRYGALLRLEEEAWRRSNVAARQQPESLSEQIGAVRAAGDAARGAWRIMHGDVTGAADLASAAAMRSTSKFLKEQQTSDALIRRAFQMFEGKPIPVDIPPQPTIRGLLPRGPLVTPPPPDPSGVRATRAAPVDYDANARPIYSSDPNATAARPPVIDAQFAQDAPPPSRPPRDGAIDVEFSEVSPRPQGQITTPDVRGRLTAAPYQPQGRELPPAPEPPAPPPAPVTPTPPVPDNSYGAAYRAHEAAQKAHRAGTMGDEEYLRIRREFMAARDALNAADMVEPAKARATPAPRAKVAPRGAKVSPAKVTTQPTAKAPAQPPTKAAAKVEQQIDRVIDLQGATSGAHVRAKIIAALSEEAEKVKPTSRAVEIRPGKAYGGREFSVLVDGEPVASVNRYGEMQASYGADDDLVQALRDPDRPKFSSDNERTLGGLHGAKDMTPSELYRFAQLEVSKRLHRQAGTVTIQIPGDGTFTIARNPAAIQEVIRRVAKSDVSAWKNLATTRKPRR